MKRDRILVTEMLYPEGHKTSNEARLKILSNFSDIVLVDDGKYYSEMDLNSIVKRIYVSHNLPSKQVFYKVKRYLPFIKYSPLEFWAYLWLLIKIAFKSFFLKYDYVLLLSVRTDALAFGRLLFRKPIIVVHHNDIDRLLIKPTDLYLFNWYKNKINHIVIADFIKEGLTNQFMVSSDKIFVVHEALVNFMSFDDAHFASKRNLILGLGQTCDEDILNVMIRMDQSCKEDLPYKIYMRNKTIEYSGKNLQITNRYLSREEYNKLLLEAKACVLFYPKEYNLRYSGIIGDSLEYGLSVYGNNIPVVRFYSELYPNTCHLLDSPKDLFDEIQKSKVDAFLPEIKDYYEKHSYKYISSQLQNMFCELNLRVR